MIALRNVEGTYFNWLCDLVDVNQADKSYYILARTLHKREFYGFVPNDDNRAKDGQKLREDFAIENSYEMKQGKMIVNDDIYNKYIHELVGPCSVFEMMVALAKRIENDILFDPEKEDLMKIIFWEMIKNLGLDSLTDDDYYDKNGSYICMKVLNNLLSRHYKRNGHGGLFPLRHAKTDQRKVEIWYQMSAYLDENYKIL